VTRASAVPTALPMGDRLRRAVEKMLPWYDPAHEAQRAERTESIRRRSIAARIAIEHLTPDERQRVHDAYAAYACELEHRVR
jgi:hypothetical protein